MSIRQRDLDIFIEFEKIIDTSIEHSK